MIIEISRNKILKAIRTEPLSYGKWFKTGYNTDINDPRFGTIAAPNCTVCAVGAVLRNCLDRSQDDQYLKDAATKATLNHGDFSLAPDVFQIQLMCIQRFPNRSKNEKNFTEALKAEAVEHLKKKKQHMAVLSFLFEGLCRIVSNFRNRYGNLKPAQLNGIRRQLCNFVINHFPRKIQININGAKPAKDIKIIKKGHR